MHTYTHVYVCISVYVRMYVCVCTYLYVCICMCVYMRVCMYICVYACMYVCMIHVRVLREMSGGKCPIVIPQDIAQVDATCFSDRKSTRLNSSHQIISYAVFC